MPAQQLERKRRLACDRCHSQKLRCPRPPGQSSCARCRKMGADCVFGVSRRGTRPTKESTFSPASEQFDQRIQVPVAFSAPDWSLHENSTEQSGFQQEMLPDLASIEWPSIFSGFNEPLSAELSQALAQETPVVMDMSLHTPPSMCSSGTEDRSWHASVFSTDTNNFSQGSSDGGKSTDGAVLNNEPPFNTSHLVMKSSSQYHGAALKAQATPAGVTRKLSELSLDLSEHAESIPQGDIYDDPQIYAERAKSTTFAIDDMFNLSQALIDIYETFFDAFFPNPQERSRADQQPIINSPGVDPFSPWKQGAEDISSIYLLLSCHERLIEIWTIVMKHCVAVENFRSSSGRAEYGSVGGGCRNGSPLPKPMQRMLLMLMSKFLAQLSQRSSDLLHKLEKSHSSSQTPTDPQSKSIPELCSRVEMVIAGAAHVKQRTMELEENMVQTRQIMLK